LLDSYFFRMQFFGLWCPCFLPFSLLKGHYLTIVFQKNFRIVRFILFGIWIYGCLKTLIYIFWVSESVNLTLVILLSLHIWFDLIHFDTVLSSHSSPWNGAPAGRSRPRRGRIPLHSIYRAIVDWITQKWVFFWRNEWRFYDILSKFYLYETQISNKSLSKKLKNLLDSYFWRMQLPDVWCPFTYFYEFINLTN